MVDWSDGFVSIDGERFHYLRSAGCGGRPMVLLHGHSDAGAAWLPTVKAWAERYDVILPDNRGHGQSPRVEPDQEIDNIADATAVLRALQLEGVLLGGHSMGAYTAAGVAATAPELVSVLVLSDPPWRPPEGEPQRGPESPWFQRTMRLKDMTPEERIAVEHADHPTWSQEELEAWADAKAQYDYDFLRTRRPWGGWLEHVKRLRCPGLLVTGETSLGAIVSTPVAWQVSKAWPQVQVVRVPGAGHNIRRDQPEAFRRAVEAFLEKEYPA